MGMSNIELFYYLLFRGGVLVGIEHHLSTRERLFLTIFTHHLSYYSNCYFKNPSCLELNGSLFRRLRRTFVHSIDGFHTIPYDEGLSDEDSVFVNNLQIECESSDMGSLNEEVILPKWIVGFHNHGYDIIEFLYIIFKYTEDVFTRDNITNAINCIEDMGLKNHYEKEWEYLLTLDLEFECFDFNSSIPIPLHKSRHAVSRHFFENPDLYPE